MDAISILIIDHQEAKRAMAELAKAPAALRNELLTALMGALEMHDVIEEQTFYPAVDANPKAFGISGMDKDAHKAIEQAFIHVSTLASDAPEWSRAFASARGMLMKHIDDEEFKTFVRVREIMSTEELAELGRRMEQQKDRLVYAALTPSSRRHAVTSQGS